MNARSETSEMRHSTFGGADELNLDDMDPSLANGYRVLYDNEVPVEIRLADAGESPEAGTLENIRIKILVQGEMQNPEGLKVELTTESDLFFYYISEVDEQNFLRLKEEQKLNIEFNGFPNLVTKLFSNCLKDPNTYFGVLFLQKDGLGRLDFIQNIEYKFLELLTIDFSSANEDLIRQSITFRYNLQKSKCGIFQSRLKEVGEIVKLKNPSLLLQLQKGNINPNASRMGNSTMSATKGYK